MATEGSTVPGLPADAEVVPEVPATLLAVLSLIIGLTAALYAMLLHMKAAHLCHGTLKLHQPS